MSLFNTQGILQQSLKEALKNLKSAFNGVVIAEDKMKEQLKEFGLLK